MWYYEGGIRIEPDWNVKGLLLAPGWSHDKLE